MLSFLKYDPLAPMLFTRLSFWVFLCVILLIYSFIYKKLRSRNLFLLLASLFFYYKAGGAFVILLLLTTVINFYGAWLTGGVAGKNRRKAILVLLLVIDLGILAWCKYSYFFTGIINSILGTDIHVINIFNEISSVMTGRSLSLTTILLPIGISFYTFQLISYSIEVYRKRIVPMRDFVDFAFYISFFPQVISGPIVKATQFLPQIRENYVISRADYGNALLLILGGFVKKMVIADYISLNFVGRVFENPNLYTGFENLMAVYGYTLQIYCDFSGYTDIAIGVALLLGFRLPPNFNSPYKAKNINDFWKRWHISLTTWFRDYLFLPLAYFLSDRMKKESYFRIRTETWIYSVTTLVVFLLCGLWHGASMNFVIWGGLHGAALVLFRLFSSKGRRKKRGNLLQNSISWFITFQFVAFTWIIFRANDSESLTRMIEKILYNFHPELILPVMMAYKTVFILIFAGFMIHWIPENRKLWVKNLFIQSPELVKFSVILFILIFIYQFNSSDIVPFIYFRF